MASPHSGKSVNELIGELRRRGLSVTSQGTRASLQARLDSNDAAYSSLTLLELREVLREVRPAFFCLVVVSRATAARPVHERAQGGADRAPGVGGRSRRWARARVPPPPLF